MENHNHIFLEENGFEKLKGFENRYFINKKGDLYSVWYNKIMKPLLSDDGYYCFNLTDDTKSNRKCYIHRLLAIQYLENINNEKEVDHIDRNKTNNDLSNLRWCSRFVNANNKSSNLANLTEEEEQKRLDDIREYKRVWALNKRRSLGIQPVIAKTKEEIKEKQREYKRNLSEEKRNEMNAKRREKRALQNIDNPNYKSRKQGQR